MVGGTKPSAAQVKLRTACLAASGASGVGGPPVASCLVAKGGAGSGVDGDRVASMDASGGCCVVKDGDGAAASVAAVVLELLEGDVGVGGPLRGCLAPVGEALVGLAVRKGVVVVVDLDGHRDGGAVGDIGARGGGHWALDSGGRDKGGWLVQDVWW